MTSSEQDRDRETLAALKDHGDTPAIVRPVFIWIYGSHEDLTLVASRLRSSWQNTDPTCVDDIWVVAAEREQEATEQAILAMSQEINAALVGTGADYDGWETSVEKSN